MKQKTITLPHCELLLVELQDKSHGVKLTEKGNLTYLRYDEMKGRYPVVQKLPEGNWQLIGRLPDITEEHASKAVPTMPIQKGKTKRYITAKEALLSLMKDNEVYFENPVTIDPPSFFINEKGEYEKSSFHCEWEQHYQVKKHEEAQEQVWDINRTHIFIKQN